MRVLRPCLIAMAVYVLCYAFAYASRPRTACVNLLYFAYTPPAVPEFIEHSLYAAFWPAYRVHHDFLHGQRHTFDRERASDLPDV